MHSRRSLKGEVTHLYLTLAHNATACPICATSISPCSWV